MLRSLAIWVGLAAAILAPLAVAANSPFLAWRDPVYIIAAFAGVLALAVLFLQPLLAGAYLPGLPMPRARRLHGWMGVMLVTCVLVHVGGLLIASPPDAIDALLLRSPTPFSVWGVLAMWATFAAALLAALRARKALPPRIWRIGHTALVIAVVLATIAHALLIEGTMGDVSKAILCLLALAATARAVYDLRAWVLLARRRR